MIIFPKISSYDNLRQNVCLLCTLPVYEEGPDGS